MDDEAGTTNGNSGAKLGEQASQRLAEMRGEIGHLDRRTRRFVQDRPLTAVLTAVAGGYLVAPRQPAVRSKVPHDGAAEKRPEYGGTGGGAAQSVQ
jgi:hypothetical protein